MVCLSRVAAVMARAVMRGDSFCEEKGGRGGQPTVDDAASTQCVNVHASYKRHGGACSSVYLSEPIAQVHAPASRVLRGVLCFVVGAVREYATDVSFASAY